MNKDIYVSRMECSIDTTCYPEIESISGIIEEVRGPKHEKTVTDIRNGKKSKLSSLPCFFPATRRQCRKFSDNDKPSGLVQFDVDLKDNAEDFNVSAFKNAVCALPECVYCFNSSGGGVKFAILTDFQKGEGDTTASLKKRYKTAYYLSEEHVRGVLGPSFKDVVYDKAVKSIAQSCFLSHDLEAYHNPTPEMLSLNEKCLFAEPSARSRFCNRKDSRQSTHALPHDIDPTELLHYIPQNLNRSDRFPINAAILSEMGAAGIPLLLRHWDKTDKVKLESQLIEILDDLSSGKYQGDISLVAKASIDNGYKPASGYQKRETYAKDSDIGLPELMSLKEGRRKLDSLVQNFFKGSEDMFLNVSAGAGKTFATETVIDQLPWGTKILWLVRDHDLAEQTSRNLSRRREYKNNTEKFENVIKNMGKTQGVRHLRGKAELCANDEVKHRYLKIENLPYIPSQQCIHDCHVKASCPYVKQFNLHQYWGDYVSDDIRIMTHNELFEENPSVFFNGTDARGNITDIHKWTPDYIIIDENVIEKNDHIHDAQYHSIKKIVGLLLNGSSIEEAVDKNLDSVLEDYKVMRGEKPSAISGDNTEDIVEQFRAFNAYEAKQSRILEQLYSYARTMDTSLLRVLRFDGEKLKLSELKQMADRYIKVPKLFLDASADRRVVAAAMPNAAFHEVKIKSADTVNIIQAENFNISKTFLKDATNRKDVVEGLIKIVTDNKYEDVGIITYKERVQDFASALGIDKKKTAYFGKQRGKNDFKNCDCLFVIGRYNIHPHVLDYLYAVFQGDLQASHENSLQYLDAQYPLDALVRMKSGQPNKRIQNSVYVGQSARSIHKHYAISETLQSVFRIRPLESDRMRKNVYILSNESLGSDIGITEFIRLGDFYLNPDRHDAFTKFENAADHLKEATGFCQLTHSGKLEKSVYQQIGLTAHYIETRMDEIRDVFLEEGFTTYKVLVRKGTNKPRDRYYLVNDRLRFKLHIRDLETQEYKIQSIIPPLV